MASSGPGDRVLRLCGSRLDERTLRAQLLAEIRRAVGFDAYAWLLTDPQTSVGGAPLADVPCLSDLPQLIRLKYLTTANRWTTLSSPVASLAATTNGELTRSVMWRDLLRRYGVGDIASCVFSDAYGCWAFLDLWRIGGRFTAREVAFLTGIAGPVTTALRRAQARVFTMPGERRARGPVVLLLAPDLTIRAQTPETQEYLRILVPPDGDSSPVPAGAYNVAAQLLAVEAGVDASPPSTRVHLTGGVWLTLRAARLGDADQPADRTIAVTIEDSSPAERVEVFARAHGLSARERQLLGHLVTGHDTRAIARVMFLSELTVQDHLKSIFAKTSTHSRGELMSLALGP